MVDIPRAQRRTPERETPPTPAAPPSIFTLSADETIEVGRALGQQLTGGELILLEGDLGLGKTTLVKGLAAGLGIVPDDVTSPSFTLVQEYVGGRLPMFHVDLYRLDEPDELATLGIEEILTAGGVVVVEWGEKLPPFLRANAWRVRFYDIGEDSRRIDVVRPDQSSR